MTIVTVIPATNALECDNCKRRIPMQSPYPDGWVQLSVISSGYFGDICDSCSATVTLSDLAKAGQ